MPRGGRGQTRAYWVSAPWRAGGIGRPFRTEHFAGRWSRGVAVDWRVRCTFGAEGSQQATGRRRDGSHGLLATALETALATQWTPRHCAMGGSPLRQGGPPLTALGGAVNTHVPARVRPSLELVADRDRAPHRRKAGLRLVLSPQTESGALGERGFKGRPNLDCVGTRIGTSVSIGGGRIT